MQRHSEQRQAFTAGVGDDGRGWAPGCPGGRSGRGSPRPDRLRQPGTELLGDFAVGTSCQDTVLAGGAEADGDGEQTGTRPVQETRSTPQGLRPRKSRRCGSGGTTGRCVCAPGGEVGQGVRAQQPEQRRCHG